MKENKKDQLKTDKRRQILIFALTAAICAIGMLIMQNVDDLTALTFRCAAGIMIVPTIVCVVDYIHNPTVDDN